MPGRTDHDAQGSGLGAGPRGQSCCDLGLEERAAPQWGGKTSSFPFDLVPACVLEPTPGADGLSL